MNSKYSFEKYVHPARWMAYWYQIKEVLALSPQNILEIGIGNKIVCNYLKSQGINVTTLDIDKSLDPDVIGSVTKIPFKDNHFDLVLCAQVLEHLSFEDFERALKELNRVSKKYVVLSLPHFGPMVKLSLKFPFIKEVKFAIKLYFPLSHKFDGQHHWEIGKKGYSPSKIKKILKKYFKLKKDFIPFESHYHHFYILEK